jgi:hypothetical protein
MLTDEIALVTCLAVMLMQTKPTDQQDYAYVEVGQRMRNDLGDFVLATDALLLVDLKTGSVLGSFERR